MSALGALDHLRTPADVSVETSVSLLVGAARQLLAALGDHGDRSAQVPTHAVKESLALLRVITGRLDELLVHRYLNDDEFYALIEDGRLVELRRRVWADADATAREYAALRHEVEMRRQVQALGLAS